MLSPSLQVFAGHDLRKVLLRIPIARLASVAVCPVSETASSGEASSAECSGDSKALRVACFSQGSGGAPDGAALHEAVVQILEIPDVLAAAQAKSGAGELVSSSEVVASPQQELMFDLHLLLANRGAHPSPVAEASVGVATSASNSAQQPQQQQTPSASATNPASQSGSLIRVDVSRGEFVREAAAKACDSSLWNSFREALVRCVASAGLGEADSIELKWSSTGKALLVLAHATIDTRGGRLVCLRERTERKKAGVASCCLPCKALTQSREVCAETTQEKTTEASASAGSSPRGRRKTTWEQRPSQR